MVPRLTAAEDSEYQVLITEQAQQPFQALRPATRAEIRRVMEGIAELAAIAPPVNPLWLKLPSMRTPLLRLTVGEVEIRYEVDTDRRLISLRSVTRGQLELGVHAPMP